MATGSARGNRIVTVLLRRNGLPRNDLDIQLPDQVTIQAGRAGKPLSIIAPKRSENFVVLLERFFVQTPPTETVRNLARHFLNPVVCANILLRQLLLGKFCP